MRVQDTVVTGDMVEMYSIVAAKDAVEEVVTAAKMVKITTGMKMVDNSATATPWVSTARRIGMAPDWYETTAWMITKKYHFCKYVRRFTFWQHFPHAFPYTIIAYEQSNK